MLCFAPLCFFFVLCLNAAFAFIFVVIVVSAGVFPLIHPLHDGASKNIQELGCVCFPVEDCDFYEKWQEEDSVARRPILLLLRSRKVAGGGAKEDFCDRETDIVAVCSKSGVNLERKTEGELRSPAKENPTTDFPSELFQATACTDVN